MGVPTRLLWWTIILRIKPKISSRASTERTAIFLNQSKVFHTHGTLELKKRKDKSLRLRMMMSLSIPAGSILSIDVLKKHGPLQWEERSNVYGIVNGPNGFWMNSQVHSLFRIWGPGGKNGTKKIAT